jgi:hypothetical protein
LDRASALAFLGHRHRHLSAPASASESARPHGHLEALKSRFPESLEGCEILDSGGNDDAYRLFVAKPA